MSEEKNFTLTVEEIELFENFLKSQNENAEHNAIIDLHELEKYNLPEIENLYDEDKEINLTKVYEELIGNEEFVANFKAYLANGANESINYIEKNAKNKTKFKIENADGKKDKINKTAAIALIASAKEDLEQEKETVLEDGKNLYELYTDLQKQAKRKKVAKNVLKGAAAVVLVAAIVLAARSCAKNKNKKQNDTPTKDTPAAEETINPSETQDPTTPIVIPVPKIDFANVDIQNPVNLYAYADSLYAEYRSNINNIDIDKNLTVTDFENAIKFANYQIMDNKPTIASYEDFEDNLTNLGKIATITGLSSLIKSENYASTKVYEKELNEVLKASSSKAEKYTAADFEEFKNEDNTYDLIKIIDKLNAIMNGNFESKDKAKAADAYFEILADVFRTYKLAESNTETDPRYAILALAKENTVPFTYISNFEMDDTEYGIMDNTKERYCPESLLVYCMSANDRISYYENIINYLQRQKMITSDEIDLLNLQKDIDSYEVLLNEAKLGMTQNIWYDTLPQRAYNIGGKTR